MAAGAAIRIGGVAAARQRSLPSLQKEVNGYPRLTLEFYPVDPHNIALRFPTALLAREVRHADL